MDVTPLFQSLKSKEYVGGLLAGFTLVSLAGYLMQGALPDIVSAISFTIVFSLSWVILDNLSLLR